MLESVIPNYCEEMTRLEELGTSGFVLGFGLRFGRPYFLLNHYPQAWTELYEQQNYLLGDPVSTWALSHTGTIRWSDISDPDPREIFERANLYGLKYGAVTVTLQGGKRSYLSLARHDRELTDAELVVLQSKIELWANLFAKARNSLTDPELDVLAQLAVGLKQSEAAHRLKISVSTLKTRLDSAQRKLGATNALNAVVLAIRHNLI